MKTLHSLPFLSEEGSESYTRSVPATWSHPKWFNTRTVYQMLKSTNRGRNVFWEICMHAIFTACLALPLVSSREQPFLANAVKTYSTPRVWWITAREIFCCSKYSYWWKQLVSNTIWEKSKDDGKCGEGSCKVASLGAQLQMLSITFFWKFCLSVVYSSEQTFVAFRLFPWPQEL